MGGDRGSEPFEGRRFGRGRLVQRGCNRTERLFDPAITEGAQRGFYVVYLFSAGAAALSSF